MRPLVLHAALACAALLHAQNFKKVRYLDEIGHLNSEVDSRKSVDLGIATARVSEDETRLEGRDNAGRRWTAIVPILGGVGFTDVWRGDFDANGREDLMIAAHYPANGRCVNPMTITFLMFDEHARPVPWTISTEMPKNGGPERMPAFLRDHEGRAEFVATDCEYSDPSDSSFWGEARGVSGVYVAQNARWKQTIAPDSKPYRRLLASNYSRPSVRLRPWDPSAWTDFSNEPLRDAGPLLLEQVLRPARECQGIRVDIVDGRVAPPHDSCEELGLGGDRLKLSNGQFCLGWPDVIIDGPEGREIISAESFQPTVDEAPTLLESKLRQIAASHRGVTLIGQTRRAQCSPTQLWTTH